MTKTLGHLLTGTLLTGTLLALLLPAIASADVKPPVTVKLPAGTFVAEHAQAAQVLYFNRCRGGCTVFSSATNDVRTRSSTIPSGPLGSASTLTEFKHGDVVWDQMMQCLREVYSPYNIVITDQQPMPGIAYNENIIAGSDNEVGISAGGVSPVTGDCSPFSYVISYTFANDFGTNPLTLCYVAAQETGHSFGMADHSFQFISDGRSACSDPMSYRGDCLSNGQRFFRNEAAFCGDFTKESCNCAGMNSHLKLISALGPGQSLIPPPTLMMKSPLAGAPIQTGASVVGNASSKRGVAKVELWLNGYKWGEKNGVPFTQTSQPASDYAIAIPTEVPDGVIDIEMTARDDIGAETKSATITVMKGAACASADTCLPGMKCEAGKCFWDPAVGELGQACAYPQYCLSGICLGATGDEEKLCTKTCVPNVGDSCPEDFECLASGNSGVCWPKTEKTGCCSAGHGVAAQSSLLGLGLLLVLRRRRRSGSRR